MPRFGGPGRPPKVKETPVIPSVAVPVAVAALPLPESDDASSTTTSEPMMMMNTKGDSTAMNNNNSHSNSIADNNKTMSALSDVVVDHSYTAPSWLLQEKQTPKFFSVPLPPVSPEMFQAVQRLVGNHLRGGDVGGNGSGGGGGGEEEEEEDGGTLALARQARLQTHQALDKLRQLRQDHKTQSKKVLHHKEKLAHAIARKNQGMEDLRRKNLLELDQSLHQLEQELLSEATAKFEQEQEELKREIERQLEQEYDAEQTLKKRKQDDALDTTIDPHKDNTAETMAAAETDEKSEIMEEGEEPENEEPKPKQVKTEAPKKELVSQQIQKKIESCQAKLDSLQEKKSEMVWLLKQVIKADAKRKAEQLKLKKSGTAPATVPGTTPAPATTTAAGQPHES